MIKIKKLLNVSIFFGILPMIVLMLMGHRYSTVHASNETKEEGDLIINLENSESIYIDNMVPGDTYAEKITLKNTKNIPIEVTFESKKIKASGNADLYGQLLLTLNYDGNEIYQGSFQNLKKFNLGAIHENEEKHLEIIQHLPGPETGNEFENAFLETEFIFTAYGEGSLLPRTGRTSPILFWIAGGILVLLGVISLVPNIKKLILRNSK